LLLRKKKQTQKNRDLTRDPVKQMSPQQSASYEHVQNFHIFHTGL